MLIGHCRGYPIEQLAEKSSHLETAYLLLYGELPSRKQYQLFETEVLHHSAVHADAETFFRSFRFVLQVLLILDGKLTAHTLPATMRTQWLCSPLPLHTLVLTTRRQTHHCKVTALCTCRFKHQLIYVCLGQTLFTKGDTVSLAIMDKQIYRLLGKATTLAA